MTKHAVPLTGRPVEADWAEIDPCKEVIAALEITERDLARLRAEFAEAKRTGSFTGLSLRSNQLLIQQEVENLHRLARGLSS
jgi:hypothetical protein